MTDVFDGDFDLSAHGFGVCAAHRIDQRRVPFEWNEYVARKSVPFPMAGQPQHAPAKAPMARTSRDYHHIQLVLEHFRAQHMVAAVIFGLRELLPHAVPVVRRVAHIGEWQRLIELCSHNIPRLRADSRRTDIHYEHSLSRTGRKSKP